MLAKEQKKEIVKNLREKLRKNKLAVFCNFEGISVDKQRDLKRQFKENKGEIFVVKRRLLSKALSEEKLDPPEIVGPVMLGLGPDEALPAKIIDKFLLEKKEKLEFIGGILNEDKKYNLLGKEEVENIAKLPSKEELLAKLVSVVQAPLANLNFVLKGNIQKLTYILTNIQK
jgi:large subunit ribosomal protein L10